MADQALPVVLNAANFGATHFDKIRDPLRRKMRQMRGYDRPDPDIRDHRPHDDKGLVLRRRADVGSDEEIVETVRHRGEVLPRGPGRPRNPRRTTSMEDMRSRRDDGYDSEGSVPPRGRVRPKSVSGRSKRRGSSSSSVSSSDLGSSTDEEKQMRKMQRKKWVTAALASVATIHAASKVYSSIEAHDKRIIQVEKGEISPEDAHKKQRAARWQDAAAIGIAALGIKGALSEWNEVHEEHIHHREMIHKHEEQHKKRLERMRRQRARDHHGYYKGRDGQWYYDGPQLQSSERSQSSATRRISQWDDGSSRDGYVRQLENGDRDSYGGRNRSRARSTYDRNDRDDDDDYSDRHRNRSRRRRDDDRY